ncbi:MAG: pilus assembly protein PilM [Tepidisphaeraceae bacterium]
MLGFVQNWLAPRGNPIGIDFGSDCLRLAQVQWTGTEHRLIAAASADVPSHLPRTLPARLAFFVEATRDLLSQGGFKGRQAVLGLPVASMTIQHLRMAKMDEAELKKALPWEARGKLPFDPAHALIRHMIAGEVYQDQDPKYEVILMAAAREFVDQLLDSAVKAKLDVVGMNVEPRSIVDCFSHVHRRSTETEVTNLFVDIGSSGSRAIIARGQSIQFARSIPIGGEQFNRATATELRQGVQDAKMLRLKMGHAAPALDECREKHVISPGPQTEEAFALLNAGLHRAACGDDCEPTETAAKPPDADLSRRIEQACREPLNKLVEELELCRRYYETTFPSKPVERLIFVGGEARHRSLCQHIAREMGLAAEVGDPLVRMGRISDIGIESGIDRREPQPSWTVAVGLSLGSVLAEVAVEARS